MVVVLRQLMIDLRPMGTLASFIFVLGRQQLATPASVQGRSRNGHYSVASLLTGHHGTFVNVKYVLYSDAYLVAMAQTSRRIQIYRSYQSELFVGRT